MDYLKAILLTQLFYSLAITLLLYSVPPTTLANVHSFSDLSNNIDITTITGQIQNTLSRQTKVSVVDLGALVLFSGNILLDLLTNFAFALPQMITLLINGTIMLVGIDAQITLIIQTFATVMVMIMYSIGLLSMLTNIRSGRPIV